MAEPERWTFSYPEVAEALVKKQGIHDGIWGVSVEFGISATNVGGPEKGDQIFPAAIVPVLKLALQKFKSENNLTVDAAKVNPRLKKPSTKGGGR